MANKKKRKKRLKRQLLKRIKQTPKVIETVEAGQLVETVLPATKDIKSPVLYLGKYEKENEAYQEQLNAVYGGSVTAKEKYINPHASILHYCHDCKNEWYSKPLWLLKKANQQHICNVDLGKLSDIKRSRRAITDGMKKQMVEMAEQGMSNSRIALTLGISRPTVINYLRKAGL